jgi:hypothetical protein
VGTPRPIISVEGGEDLEHVKPLITKIASN